MRNTYKEVKISVLVKRMVMNEMKFIKIQKTHYAVAGVIEALLLVALFSIVLSTIQLVYIPDIMEQREV